MLLKKAGNDNRAYLLASKAETYDKANATDKMVKALAAGMDASTLALCTGGVVKGTVETEFDGTDGTKLTAAQITQNKECQVTDASQLRYVLVR